MFCTTIECVNSVPIFFFLLSKKTFGIIQMRESVWNSPSMSQKFHIK